MKEDGDIQWLTIKDKEGRTSIYFSTLTEKELNYVSQFLQLYDAIFSSKFFIVSKQNKNTISNKNLDRDPH